ncbi:hypothetical protein [Escherichia coli]|uniref:hypothetical protein n=1 Tax=Escherichia coli TaxID=562 RepID=UPI003DA42C65
MSSALKVIRTERVKARTKCDCIVEALAPTRPIDAVSRTPDYGFALTGKYREHPPPYRQRKSLPAVVSN